MCFIRNLGGPGKTSYEKGGWGQGGFRSDRGGMRRKSRFLVKEKNEDGEGRGTGRRKNDEEEGEEKVEKQKEEEKNEEEEGREKQEGREEVGGVVIHTRPQRGACRKKNIQEAEGGNGGNGGWWKWRSRIQGQATSARSSGGALRLLDTVAAHFSRLHPALGKSTSANSFFQKKKECESISLVAACLGETQRRNLGFRIVR